MATLKAESLYEKLHKESKVHFEKIKEKLTQNVVENIEKYGYQRIYFHCMNDKERMEVKRYPNGEDCPEIHISLADVTAQYFTDEGLHVIITRWTHSSAIKEFKISI